MALDYEPRVAATPASGKPIGVDQRTATSPANIDHAKGIRAMIAARVNAPKPTAKSMRQAIATAKATPGLGRDRDTGTVTAGNTSGGGKDGGSELVVQQVAFLLALIAIWAGWPLVRLQIAGSSRGEQLHLGQ